MSETKGIVLIALGHPYYGRMAGNLAAGIRYKDKDTPIHLVWCGQSLNHLTEAHRNLFTSFQECPKEFYYKGDKRTYLKAKTCIYELSPFDTTIFLDVDLILFGQKPISQLFEELKEFDFTFQNRGFTDLSAEKLNAKFCDWCDITQVKSVYGATGRFYHLASEFIYFKKNETNKRFFDTAREIFDNPKVPGARFAGDLPDEYAFDIAAALLQQYPHKDNYVNIFWFAADGKGEINELIKKYYGYSIGGGQLPEYVLRRYNELCRHSSKALGLPFHYRIKQKREWLPERRTAVKH